MAIVLGHLGERAMRQRVVALTEMTRRHWQGRHLGDGYYDRSEAIPILFTNLEMLIERGPLAAVWRRAGCDGPIQPLHAALDGPEAHAQHQNARRVQQQADQADAERRRKERELLATACPHCHRTADKYKNPRYASDGEKLCRFCQQKADQAAQTEAAQQITAAAQAHSERVQIAENASFLRTVFGPRKPKETKGEKT
ncbi:hypothetical protein [Kitasatospora sp. NPDC059599]|uniref:hypothetical protein n=1 Tax=Kitasatospora sp. NPDC059599 TaxID=3346880 RepID=UPI0036934247